MENMENSSAGWKSCCKGEHPESICMLADSKRGDILNMGVDSDGDAALIHGLEDAAICLHEKS
ncbi:MAG: hypothetical protein LBS92_01545 [Candidatus Methanoplasma sp.]|nr:hypothetical protein [Candidatus Methanoplasma sp.]